MNSSMSVLLIDDDDVASESVVRSLKKNVGCNPIVLAQDGLEALDILRGEHPALNIVKPFLVLLDLNMPRMNGFEFLREVRSDANLRDCVIFVLTTSDADTDRTQAYRENIAGYLVKSAVGPKFTKLATLLEDYQNVVRLPS